MNGDRIEVEPPANRLEVNKLLRVLNGKSQKYTIHLLMKDGKERQIQTSGQPFARWDQEARSVMLSYRIPQPPNTYETVEVPICRFDDVEIIQCEENPQ